MSNAINDTIPKPCATIMHMITFPKANAANSLFGAIMRIKNVPIKRPASIIPINNTI
ncbi:hypothetical protein D3C78_1862500 [compost metagenome]